MATFYSRRGQDGWRERWRVQQGRQHEIFRLQLPELQGATKLFLEHLEHREECAVGAPPKAEEIVKCVGRLPLAATI